MSKRQYLFRLQAKEKLFEGYFNPGDIFTVETECGLEIQLAKAERDERKAGKIWCPVHQKLESVTNVTLNRNKRTGE
jgi:hypothetical protein